MFRTNKEKSPSECIKESEQLIDHALALAKESEQIGAKTIENLQMQGEQLQRIEIETQQITTQIKIAEEKLEEIKRGFFWYLTYYFRKIIDALRSEVKKLDELKQTLKNRQAEIPLPEIEQPEIEPPKIKLTDLIDRERFDKKDIEAMDRTDEKLDALMKGVSQLHQQALFMGKMLDQQNQRLDEIIENTDKNQDDLAIATTTTKKLIN